MARWLIFFFASLLALVLNLLMFSMSPWGGDRIAGVAERLLSREVAGTIRLGAVRWHGMGDLEVERAVLLDPAGAVAATVDELRVDLLLRPLLQRRLVVRELWVEGAKVRIDPEDPRGGLSAVFEPSEEALRRQRPAPKEPRPPQAPIPIELRSLHLEDAGFLLAAPEGEPEVAARGVWGWMRGSWEGSDATLWLELRAQVLRPLAAPLHVELETSLSRWKLDLAALTVRLGATTVEAFGVGDLDSLQGDVTLTGVVGPEEAGAMGIPLVAPTPLRGVVHLGHEATYSLRLGSRGAGRLEVQGEATGFRRLLGVARLEAFDPGGWIADAPRGRLEGKVRFDAQLSPTLRVAIDTTLEKGEPIGPGTIRGRWEEGALSLDEVRLSLAGAEVVAKGSLRDEEVDAKAKVAISDLGLLAGWLGPTLGGGLPTLAGRGTLDVTASGALGDPRIELSGRFPMLRVDEAEAQGVELRGVGRLEPPRGEAQVQVGLLRWREIELRDAHLRAHLDARGALTFRLEGEGQEGNPGILSEGSATISKGRAVGEVALAASGVGKVEARFDLPLDFGDAPPRTPLALRLEIDPLAMGQLGALAGVELPSALLRASLSVEGTVGNPLASLVAFVEDLQPPAGEGIPPLSLHLHATLAAGTLALTAQGFQAGGRILEVEASLPVDAPLALRDPAAAGGRALASRASEAKLQLRGVDLEPWSRLVGFEGATGVVSLDLHLLGPIRQPRGEVRLELAAGSLGPLHRVDAVWSLRSGAEVVVEGEMSVEGQPPLAVVARAGVPLVRLLEAPEAAEVEVAWRLAPLDLSALPLGLGAGGILRTEGRFAGTLGALRGRASVDLQEFETGDLLLGSASARLQVDEAIEVHAFGIDPEGGTLQWDLAIAERQPLLWIARGQGERLLAAPASTRLDVVDLSLRPLQLLPFFNRASGALSASLHGEGALEAFLPQGEARIEGGEVQLVGGATYDRIGLRASLSADRLELSLLEAHAGRGIAVLQGEVVRLREQPAERRGPPGEGSPLPWERARFDLRLRSKDFPVGGEAGVVARVSTRGTVQGTLSPRRLESTISLEDAEIVLPELVGRELQTTTPPPDVVIFGAPSSQRRRGPELPMVVRLGVQRPVTVRGPDVFLAAQVGGTLVRTRAGALLATGEVATREGSVALLGRRFSVEPSVLRWDRSPPTNPLLDLSARFQGVGATAWIDVGGTLQSPTVHLRSDPPMQEAEIAVLIATGGGRTPGLTPEEGRVEEKELGVGVAASLAGSVVTDRLRHAIGPGLPLDVLSVETAEGQTLVQAGTYLGPGLYVGYARNILPEPGENANEVRVTYQLTRSVAVQSRFGDAANGGVDLVWVEHFPTGAQVESRRESTERQREEQEEAAQRRRRGRGARREGRQPPAAPEPPQEGGTEEEAPRGGGTEGGTEGGVRQGGGTGGGA